jgi:hypothetical protein
MENWLNRNYREIMLVLMCAELVLIFVLVLQGAHR